MRVRTKVKLWWNRLWIRKNEFHSSLNLDIKLISEMTKEEYADYRNDLMRRRQLAHEQEMYESDRKHLGKLKTSRDIH